MTKISFWLPSSGYPDSNSCKIVTVITLVVWKVKEKQSLSVRSCFQPIISSSKVKLVLKMSIFSTNPLFGLLFWTHQTSPWEMVDGWSLLNLVCSHQRVWNSKRLFWLFLGVFLYCKDCYLFIADWIPSRLWRRTLRSEILPQKLFLFARYFSFCLDSLAVYWTAWLKTLG